MPNSLKSPATPSPASRRATNCSLSSITEHSFQGITPSPKGKECHPCVRYKLSPMCQAAQRVCLQWLHAISSNSFRTQLSIEPGQMTHVEFPLIALHVQ